MEPLVSIIIPTRDRAHLLLSTIESIIRQDYIHWECIVVDDNSTDDTFKVIDEIAKTEQRIKYYKLPDSRLSGANSARNFGFENSKGQYINWLDSDDLIEKNKISSQIKKISSGDFDCCICQTSFFGGDLKLEQKWNNNLYSKNLFNDFLQKNIGWSINAPLYEKSFLEKNNIKFDEKLKNSQDFDFHLRLILLKCKIIFDSKVLVRTRIHSKSIANNPKKGSSKLIVFKKVLNSCAILTDSSQKYLYLQIKKNISKSLLDGEITFVIKYFIFLLSLQIPRYYKIIYELLPKLFFSVFFKLTGKGYSLVKE